jgi:hypothetical protein
MKNCMSYTLSIVFLIIVSISDLQAKKVIKVLAIGNSFSVDAVEQNLYELAKAQGDSLIIGNAYIGGCSLDRHWSNAKTGKAEYSYRKIVGGLKTIYENRSLESIIKDDDWDVITFQQSSPISGQYKSYKKLSSLMKYVRKTAINKQVEFVFHITWADAQNSTNSGFINYGNDQMKMYLSIINTVERVARKYKIKRIIPSGTAVQNARTIFGDVLCRDGHHLSLSIGRYVAACTWCEFLTGKNIIGNLYWPPTISAYNAHYAQVAAYEAIKTPYEVTRICEF